MSRFAVRQKCYDRLEDTGKAIQPNVLFVALSRLASTRMTLRAK
jgi:hypothetical protein